MSRSHTLTIVSCAAALAVGGASLAASATAGDAPPPLVIAVESPQSGGQASNGLDQLRGAELAVREVNARGGVLGRQVTIYRADDRGDQAGAVALAQRIVARGIHFVVGPYNSSVGLVTLPIYRTNGVLPVWNTSRDATAGSGATVQPMNSQIAPIESRYILRAAPRRVVMLVDDTPNGAFTAGMAARLAKVLRAKGVIVTRISLAESTYADGSRAVPDSYYAGKVAEALALAPDLIYVSTYFPEGALVARALAAAPTTTKCLMGLANPDHGFIAATTLVEAQRCVFSGVAPTPTLTSAWRFVRRYRTTFNKQPGTWGVYYYDSMRILFAAITRAGSERYGAVNRALRATRNFRGATGAITIDPATGYRPNVPVRILAVNANRQFVLAK
jgi:branched-chain amino acid transport system substrate-binding protein